jgi:hypothetical protein
MKPSFASIRSRQGRRRLGARAGLWAEASQEDAGRFLATVQELSDSDRTRTDSADDIWQAHFKRSLFHLKGHQGGFELIRLFRKPKPEAARRADFCWVKSEWTASSEQSFSGRGNGLMSELCIAALEPAHGGKWILSIIANMPLAMVHGRRRCRLCRMPYSGWTQPLRSRHQTPMSLRQPCVRC